METRDVRSMVLSKLSEHVSISTDNPELVRSQKLSELDLDSLAILEILYDLEDYYSINVDSSELQRLATVEDLVTVVSSTMANAA